MEESKGVKVITIKMVKNLFAVVPQKHSTVADILIWKGHVYMFSVGHLSVSEKTRGQHQVSHSISLHLIVEDRVSH